MEEYVFSYTLCLQADAEQFEKVCLQIEKNIPGVRRESRLVDVDGTLIQVYNTEEGKIKVVSDCEVDAVYVDASIGLKRIKKAPCNWTVPRPTDTKIRACRRIS